MLAIGYWPAGVRGELAVEQLSVAGSDSVLWLIAGTRESGESSLTQWFYCFHKERGQIEPVSKIVPQVGRIDQLAVTDDAVHVFYDNGVYCSYSRLGARREVRLPDAARPVVMAGEAGSGPSSLWALVSARTADQVETAWRERLQRESSRAARKRQSSGGEQVETAPATLPASEGPRPVGSHHLVRYDGSQWLPGFAVPEGFSADDRSWLCAGRRQVCLLWQTESNRSEIRFAWRGGQDWVVGKPLVLPQPMAAAFAAMADGRLLFISLLDQPGGTGSLQCRLWGHAVMPNGPSAAGWQPLAAPQGADGQPLDVMPGTVATLFKDQLVLARTAGGHAESGMWSLEDGKVVSPFAVLRLRRSDERTSSSRNLAELIVILVLGMIVFLVLRRRQEALLFPVILPSEAVVAGLFKRFLGAIVDMVPAAVLVAWLWWEPIRQFAEDVYTAALSGEHAAVPETLLWANVSFRLVYSSYCLIWEMIRSATPGKRLMGCRVATESLERPSRLQILGRNLLRVLELDPVLIIFLAVIFLTPHRQRIGDLVARTIVIEDQLPEPVGGQEEDGTDASNNDRGS